MERLKGDKLNLIDCVGVTFTFQYGEIKSLWYDRGTAVEMPFTFQYGEIKSEVCITSVIKCVLIYIPVWRD